MNTPGSDWVIVTLGNGFREEPWENDLYTLVKGTFEKACQRAVREYKRMNDEWYCGVSVYADNMSMFDYEDLGRFYRQEHWKVDYDEARGTYQCRYVPPVLDE